MRCITSFALLSRLAIATNPLTLTLSPTCASYALNAPNSWAFAGSSPRVWVGGVLLNASDGSLVFSSQTSWDGADAWGAFNATTCTWVDSSASPVFATSFIVYTDSPAVVFRATYPRDVQPHGRGAPVPSVNDSDSVAAEFPAFQTDGGGASLGFMQYAGTMLNQKGDAGPYSGPWTRSSPVATGRESGPLILLDSAASASLVISPSSQFMAVSSTRSVDGGAVAWGPLGSANVIPVGFSYDVVAWYGDTVNANVMSWGAALLARYNKPHGLSKSDYTNTHLGYNTDNGAYYCAWLSRARRRAVADLNPRAPCPYRTLSPDYNTGAFTNYSTALAAVYNYSQSLGIPYRHVLLDSWWYYKDESGHSPGGVINWTAQSGPGYFTGGDSGIRDLVELTGWKIIAHNRYWSTKTNYATQNGGAWPFFFDATNDTNQMAVPLSEEFWSWLLTSSVAEWGLTTYEQDWLHNEFEGVSVLLTNLTNGGGREWLLQMGQGAAAAGVTVQLCMSYPRHALQSVEMPTATQIRASDDHMPGVDSTSQWNLQWSSMLAWALGLAPFKDNYWSTALQPGGTRPGPETTPSLHNAASTLSAGPVTPGDGVGFSDPAQILRACDAGGRLLHPSRPLTGIDAAAAARVFPGSNAVTGVISATYTVLPSGLYWDHILAANLTAPFALPPSLLTPTRADAALRAAPPLSRASWLRAPIASDTSVALAYAYTLNTTSLDPSTLVFAAFDEGHPIALTPCGLADFALWHTAPVLSSGVALLGELMKWVPVSEARFEDVAVDGAGARATLRGSPSEAVSVSWVSQSGTIEVSVCVIGDSGIATASIDARGVAACA